MATKMANVRLEENLKQLGDTVLQREGLTFTAAVTALYEHLANTQEIPEFLQDEHVSKTARIENKRKALRNFTGCLHAKGIDVSLDEIRDARLARQ